MGGQPAESTWQRARTMGEQTQEAEQRGQKAAAVVSWTGADLCIAGHGLHALRRQGQVHVLVAQVLVGPELSIPGQRLRPHVHLVPGQGLVVNIQSFVLVFDSAWQPAGVKSAVEKPYLGLCSEGWGAGAGSSARSTESAEDEIEAKGSKRSQSGCQSD